MLTPSPKDCDRFGTGHVVDIDIGDTFTDVIVSNADTTQWFKVEAVPGNIGASFHNALEEACQGFGYPALRPFLGDTLAMRLTTSLATNILIERKGARCGLILETGWKDRFLAQLPLDPLRSPFITAEMVAEFSPEQSLGEKGGEGANVLALVQQFRCLSQKGAEIVVVGMAGRKDFFRKEGLVKAEIHRFFPRHCLGAIPVVMAHQVATGPDFLSRLNTALLSAYCREPLKANLHRIERLLDVQGYPRPLLIAHSGGATARVAKTRAVQVLTAGRDTVLFGVERAAKELSLAAAVSMDIGGTATSVGLALGGMVHRGSVPELEGFAVDLSHPMVSTLAVGGSSVVRLDHEGEIRIGPDSIGAVLREGSGQPTLIDALSVLGYLDENSFFFGRLRLSREAALTAIRHTVAAPLRIATVQAASLIKQAAVERIGRCILGTLDAAGVAAAHASLFALGGGGGCLCAEVAAHIGVRKTYLLPYFSVFGAHTSSQMNIGHIYTQRIDVALPSGKTSGEDPCRRLNEVVLPLHRVALSDMRGEGFTPEESRFSLELDLGVPHGPSVTVHFSHPFLWPPTDWPVIRKAAKKLTGDTTLRQVADKQLWQVTLRAFAEVPGPSRDNPPVSSPRSGETGGFRRVQMNSDLSAEASIHHYGAVSGPTRISGPAFLEGVGTTVFVPPDHFISFDSDKTGIIEPCKADCA